MAINIVLTQMYNSTIVCINNTIILLTYPAHLLFSSIINKRVILITAQSFSTNTPCLIEDGCLYDQTATLYEAIIDIMVGSLQLLIVRNIYYGG
jgi:hypothetical protein